MASRTAWTGGNGAGLTWATANANAGTLANGNSVLDSTDITNGTSLDIFADVSFSCTIASSAVLAGANVAFYLALLNQDGSTYGDNHVTTTPGSAAPSYAPAAVIPLFVATVTSLIGNYQGIILPPGTFRWIVQNNSGFAFTAATIKYRTYNTNLNN